MPDKFPYNVRVCDVYATAAANRLQQMKRATEIMDQFRRYAASIGCVMGTGAAHDSIDCTPEQAEKMQVWWEENTKDLK